ncbi:MAG: DUF1800 domain-containing protein [Pirellulales bacterium]
MPHTSATIAWQAYKPDAQSPWNRQRVVHLHRRAAFAATWEEIERDLAEGPQAAVDRLLSGTARSQSTPVDFELMSQTIGEAAQASNNVDRLQAWWLYRMLLSPDPLGERLSLLWHNHFATSNRKVQNLAFMHQQNELFHKHARAGFGELLAAVVKHPAMLVWLDADSNRRGHANENLARELLELFTLGIGNYTEQDVKEAARALTGWTVAEGAFRFVAERYDDGEKQLLGEHGRFAGEDLLRLLLDHPATSRRIAWRICGLFFAEGVVDDRAIDELAGGLRERHLDVGWAVQTVLQSTRFFAKENLRTRVVGPVEFAVGTLHALALGKPPPSTLLLADWTSRMGQDLFNPPNVGGWSEGRAWLGSRSIVARANFAAALVERRLWTSAIAPEPRNAIPLTHHGGDLKKTIGAFAELLWGEVLPSVVEECLAEIKDVKEPDARLSASLYWLLAHPESLLG